VNNKQACSAFVTTMSAIKFMWLGIVLIILLSACNGNISSRVLNQNDSNLPISQLSLAVRVVKHTLGETKIPTNPQRVVTINFITLSNAITLGIRPIGSTSTYANSTDFPNYLKDKIETKKLLGLNWQPNLEGILLVKPDLILGIGLFNQTTYSLLSKIAPTVVYDWKDLLSWREYFNAVATTLGKEEKAKEIWKQYYKRIKQLKAALGNYYQGQKISLLILGQGGMYSEVKNSFAGSILNDVGLQRPTAQDIEAKSEYITISEEELQKADGDILFVAPYLDEDKSYLEKLQQKPLWKKLKAVQKNHVYVVRASTWRGWDILAANALIDDLFKYLVGHVINSERLHEAPSLITPPSALSASLW
jgi:iron complex transport system substrate-binding protein